MNFTPFTIVAPTSSADGYGYSAEALILNAVNHYNADIAFIEHDWRDSRYTDPQLLDLRVNDSSSFYRDLMVVYFLPFALGRFRSKITLGMSMWETDKLPDSWASCLHLADGWIVPSLHSYRVFSKHYNGPIAIVPFGTDIDWYQYWDRPTDGVCKFLMSGLLHYRKGVEFALRAFREEFSRGEDVSLTLKTRRNCLDCGPEIHTLADSRITVIDEDYDRLQMRELYRLHDCLLATSRGEGSGLTPRDAMATGMPTILTNWSGLTEIADKRYSYPIAIDGLEIAPLECSSYHPGITGNSSIGHFARPLVKGIREAMREVYEDRASAQTKGRLAAEWMREEWSWKKCAGLWLEAIESMSTPVTYITE